MSKVWACRVGAMTRPLRTLQSFQRTWVQFPGSQCPEFQNVSEDPAFLLATTDACTHVAETYKHTQSKTSRHAWQGSHLIPDGVTRGQIYVSLLARKVNRIYDSKYIQSRHGCSFEILVLESLKARGTQPKANLG